jgi:GT2 family glycosyltransferase
MAAPPITIVVVPRERFSHARRSLESIYRHTPGPFSLVYVDGNSPPAVQRYLERASIDRGFQLIRKDRFLSPNAARNVGLAAVDPSATYVVFVDNDVEVERGWLEALVSCAEETGAWAVSPVYFEGSPRDRVIHMAGGTAEITESDGARSFDEEHLLNGVRFDAVRHDLARRTTGFFEFHCALLPLAVLQRLGPFDEELLSNHEHLDCSLQIRQAGGTIWVEPAARVTYVHGLLDDDDLAYAGLRWSDDWNRRSTARFVEKWRIREDDPWRAASERWATGHRGHLFRLRRCVRTILKHRAATSPLTRGAYAWLRDTMR